MFAHSRANCRPAGRGTPRLSIATDLDQSARDPSGTILAASKSTVRRALLRHQKSERSALLPWSRARQVLSGGSMHRILLVDDDISLTDMIREFLELEGFAVEAVYDGSACLGRDLGNTDLVVLDVMLPGLSGFEVLKRLRQN